MTPAIRAAIITAAVVAAIATSAAAGWIVSVWRSDSLQAADARAQAERAIQAHIDARAEEARRTTAHAEISHAASTSRRRADADRRTADAAHRRLLDAASSAASGATTDPAATAGGPPTAGPGLVLADVLGRADDTAGELAAAADSARIAGTACERAYEALEREASAGEPDASP